MQEAAHEQVRRLQVGAQGEKELEQLIEEHVAESNQKAVPTFIPKDGFRHGVTPRAGRF